MANEYRWNRQFRLRVLALCVLPEWYVRFGPAIIQPQFFETPEEAGVCKAIHDFYARWQRPPFEDELETVTQDLEGAGDIIPAVYNLAAENALEYAAENALQFAREQAMKLAILESVDDIQKGDLRSPLERVNQAQAVGVDMTDVGLDLKRDSSWAYSEVLNDKVQTGIYHLDQLLEGGLGPGELGVVMAATSVGKTMTLINIGIGAASLMSRTNVVHITLELSAKKVAKRYAARTTFKWLRREDDPDAYLMRFQRDQRLRMPGDIYIKEWPTGSVSVREVDIYLERQKMLGIPVGMLIVDYPDEMKLPNLGEYRLNLGQAFRELRGLAAKWAIPVWAATQATRQALNKEMVTMEDIAESFDKARVSDVVVAMCQTSVEREDGVLRLFGAKVRDGEGGWMVRCTIGKDAHAILSERVITMRELIEERERRKEESRM